MSDTNTASTCTICLDEITENNVVSYLPCCHGFHQQCFNEYIRNEIKLKKNISCPNCRIEHFMYGQATYEFIMNELGMRYETKDNSYDSYIPTATYNTSISRIHNHYQHSIVTIPTQQTPRTSNRQRQHTSCNDLWFKYRFYMIALVLIVVISLVSFLIIFQ